MMGAAVTLRVLDCKGVPVSGVLYEILECEGGDCFGLMKREADDASAVLVHIPDGEETITIRASKDGWSETRTFDRSKVQFDYRSDLVVATEDSIQKLTVWSFAIGVGFMLLLLLLSSVYPAPSNSQRQIWQAILSVAGAAFANGILGLLEVNIHMPQAGLAIRAVGAIAVAVIIFFFVPAFA